MSEPTMLIVGGPRRGRRPRAAVRATARIEFVVTPAERADLERVAQELGHKALASLVREAVDEFVSDYREQTVFGRIPSGKN